MSEHKEFKRKPVIVVYLQNQKELELKTYYETILQVYSNKEFLIKGGSEIIFETKIKVKSVDDGIKQFVIKPNTTYSILEV